MKSRIPDPKIKRLIKQFSYGDRDCYRDIVQLLSPYIYNFPRIVFYSNSDDCGDFYEYVLVRLEKILKLYRETDAKFVTWFTVVLRNRYFNFRRERKSKNSVRESYTFISLDYSGVNTQSLHEVIGDWRSFQLSENNRYEALIEKIVCNLNQKQRIFFHLYYVESIRPEDIGFISITLNRTVREVLMGINKMKNAIAQKYELKYERLGKLNILYRDMVRKQAEGNLDTVEHLRNRRNKILGDYNRIKLNPSYASIAGFLRLPLGTVSTGISRMKRAVRDIIEEFCHEGLSVS